MHSLFCLNFMEVKNIFKELQINEAINVPEVRLIIAENEEQLGVVPLKAALQIAIDKGLDLVEISPVSKPPVCKIMDYGKYRFEQIKRDKEARKNQKIVNVKEVKLRLNIEDHDFFTKAKNAEKFLRSGDKVKITVMFRGREITHPELGDNLCQRFSESLAEISNVEKAAKMEGRNMTMILTPKQN